MKPGQITGPLILLAIGALFLVNNFVTDQSWPELFRGYWWVILIVIGFAQLIGVVVGPFHKKWGYLNGGLILLTVGALFGFQTLYGVGFHRTWPALLIVIGLIGVLRLMFAPLFAVGRVGRVFRKGLFQ